MPTRTEPRVFIARESAMVPFGGSDVTIRKGVTRVEEGHELLEQYPDLFEPIWAHFRVEQATAAPGERR